MTTGLDEFRTKHGPAAPPTYIPPDPTEMIQLTAIDGLRQLAPAPATDVQYGQPPQGLGASPGRYLWVIDDAGVPYLLEAPPHPTIDNAVPKHTNLTGAGDAYIGGELWFGDSRSIFVSGASRRYPAKDEAHLADATCVFEALSYAVVSLGWDRDGDRPERFLRG